MSIATILRAAAIAAGVATLAVVAGCSSQPVPDVAYYVIPPSEPVTARDVPVFSTPIVVDAFLADGLHAEQAILYSTKPGSNIKAYHYQLWNDPPARLVQRRLIKRLRDANVSPVVADRLAGGLSALHVSGFINRFERINTGTGWAADIDLEIRVDTAEDALPLLLKTYTAQVPADTETMQGTVRAFRAALDDVLGQFTADIERLQP